MCIEATDQLAYPSSTLQPGFMRRKRPRLACCYRQQRFGSTNSIHPLARRARHAVEFPFFLLTQPAQGFFLGVCHSLSPFLIPTVYHFLAPRVSK
jgi:hypothetical protein